jgi:hypothetical protein
MCQYCKKEGHTQDRCWILHPHLRPKKYQVEAAKRNFFVKTLDGGEEERKSLVSARSDTREVKSSENERVRLDRLEIILSALLSPKFGPGPSLNSLHNLQVKGPSRKPNCIFNKIKNNSVGPNGDLASGLIFELNLNGSLASGLNKNNCLYRT